MKGIVKVKYNNEYFECRKGFYIKETEDYYKISSDATFNDGFVMSFNKNNYTKQKAYLEFLKELDEFIKEEINIYK